MENQCALIAIGRNNYVKWKDEYSYQSLGTDFDREEMLEKFPGARTFPQIRIHGENIGGYTEFAEWSDGLRRV